MSRIAVVLLAAAALCQHAAAQCPSEGDCRKPHATPGCVMPECCNIVCKANPLCCEVVWDQGCADAAIESCDGISCPSEGLCTVVHPTPGCADFNCCELVTGIDGWCTWASWDSLCATLATELCAVQPCSIGPGSAIDEAEPCYRRLNDGCSIGIESGRILPACGVTYGGRITSGGPRDLDWFALDASARRRVRAVIEAEFPVELQYFRGDCEGPNDVKWIVSHAVCTGVFAVNFIADAGVSSLILGAGNDDGSMRDGLDCDEINPENPPPPDAPPPVQLFGVHWRARIECLRIGDIDGDGEVGPRDITELLSAWGPVPLLQTLDPLMKDADLDGDGQVGATDITILLSDW
jgi:hypothetical protein